MSRITDVKETVNQAIRFAITFPCHICQYENEKTGGCRAGVKYKGTCPVYRILKVELLKMREMEDDML